MAVSRESKVLGQGDPLRKGLSDGTLPRTKAFRPGPIGDVSATPQRSNEQSDGEWAEKAPIRPPAFRNIPRYSFYQSLRERMADPSKISQRTTSLCGPASLMFLSGGRWPERYYRFVSTLYESGSSTLGNLRVKPGEDCLNCNPIGSISPADWVALAGIRDSENSLWDYDDVDDEIGGITMPSTLAKWLNQVGFQNVTNETNLYFTKGEDNLRAASELYHTGHHVCMLINATAISVAPSSGDPSGIFTSANHWVVLTSEMQFQGNNLSFTIFTWGERARRVPMGSGSMPVTWWLGGYYGYVACK